jgi:hypothetical protein
MKFNSHDTFHNPINPILILVTLLIIVLVLPHPLINLYIICIERFVRETHVLLIIRVLIPENSRRLWSIMQGFSLNLANRLMFYLDFESFMLQLSRIKKRNCVCILVDYLMIYIDGLVEMTIYKLQDSTIKNQDQIYMKLLEHYYFKRNSELLFALHV